MKSITHATAQGNRDYQEDRVIVAAVPGGTLLAVADGHGGAEVSEYLRVALVQTWLYMADRNTDGDMLVKKVFASFNEDTRHQHAGSTLSLVFISDDGDHVSVAILGDSPVMIRSAGFGIPGPWIAPEHNARSNAVELAAAKARGAIYDGGYISSHYDGHGLQMTRAFGDVDLDSILSREPEIFSFLLEKPSWVLVASDGLIDPGHKISGLSYQAVADMLDAGSEAKDLVNRAVKMQTNDNASAIVWRLK